jgi:hypothetical protein
MNSGGRQRFLDSSSFSIAYKYQYIEYDIFVQYQSRPSSHLGRSSLSPLSMGGGTPLLH